MIYRYYHYFVTLSGRTRAYFNVRIFDELVISTYKITNSSKTKWLKITVRALASGLPRLQSLDIGDCWNITDAGIIALASGCRQLQSLNIGGCSKITDEGREIARRINSRRWFSNYPAKDSEAVLSMQCFVLCSADLLSRPLLFLLVDIIRYLA